VNRQLVKDVEDSGQFMTMFFLVLNTESKQHEWVRAGHDPGVVYDPGSDSFSELGGSGIALGVYGGWIYEDNKKTDFSNGQIIFLSTDGIWEFDKTLLQTQPKLLMQFLTPCINS
jgi:sigma-B regulation protein RsbU (phosphoserine phosphatase)